MRWTVLYRVTGARCLRPPFLYCRSPRLTRERKFLSINTVSVRFGSRRYAVPWKVGVLLGFGVMGGVSLSVIKYFKSDRTSNCQSQVTPPVTASEMTVSQFGVIQRLQLAARFLYLCVLFSPALTLYLLSRLFNSDTLANSSWKYVLFALQNAGPAFLKLGQWASTRRDLFPDEFCATLSVLHLRCHPHSWAETERLMEASFGPRWQEILCIVDHVPIGSGCVAQVYQGKLYHRGDGPIKQASDVAISGGVVSGVVDSDVTTSEGDGDVITGEPVAVKVLHPNIVQRMEQDICLMKYVASWVDLLYPAVYWVALTECVDEFSIIMEKQLDMEQEAKNLCRFRDQTTGYGNIKFPTPIYPYITKDVLVESFEAGTQISEYLSNPGGKLQQCLARVGVEALLDMLFVHNFVHGDLHPGNILVQDPSVKHPKLVLLDCGIATSLEPLDLVNLHSVFTAIVTGQGWKVADLFLNQKQTCATLDEFRRKVGDLVDSETKDLNLKKVRVDTLFSNLFNILMEHKVRIDPNFTSVMVAVMVIEGLGRSLDPNMDILAYARPCVLHRARLSLRDNVTNRLKQITQATTGL